MSRKFEYKYNAPTSEERKEIENIKRQYVINDPSTSKIDRLRLLDKKVKQTPIIVSITLGVIGLLFFGLGMSFFLEITEFWYLGIPSSIIGIILISIAYPVYARILKKLKAKYGEEIINLSNELLNEE